MRFTTDENRLQQDNTFRKEFPRHKPFRYTLHQRETRLRHDKAREHTFLADEGTSIHSFLYTVFS